MMREIKLLTALNLRNIFGLNVFLHNKDKKSKGRTYLLMAAWAVLIVMAAAYAGVLSFGLVQIGMGELVPAYLITIVSIVILFFGIFKAGPVIFSEKGYEMLNSLPLSERSIVISRFIRMYVENLLLSLVVMVPGLVVYAYLVKPDMNFYIVSAAAALLLPLFPITLAAAIGAAVTAITSKMKHKSIVSAFLSVLLVVAIVAVSGKLESFEGKITEEMMLNFADIITQAIKSIYPPALFMGSAVIGEAYLDFLIWAAASMAVFALTIIIISSKFHVICESLYSTSAKHNYRMESLRQGSLLAALYKRELKRYFASSVYVTNTIIGPILGVIMSVGMVITGFDIVETMFMIKIDAAGIVPFILGAMFTMMPTTSVAVSMEGKEWWIIKSLPVSTKAVLDSKILVNLSLVLPCLAVSEVLLITAIKPMGMEIVWMVIMPLLMVLFSSVFGITANLLFPVFNWENEAAAVKQSASSAIGGFGGVLAVVLFGVIYFVAPAGYKDVINGVICILLAAVTLLMYIRNNRVNLKDL